MKNVLFLIVLFGLCAGSAAAGSRADVNADQAVNAADSVCLANILAGNLDASQFNLDNVVVVAPQGGDFTDPADAADWVATQTPGQANRFVILVTPGQYSLTRPVTLPSYTTLRGYGPTNTVLQRTGGTASPPYGAVVVLNDTWNAAIENIQIYHAHGGSNVSVAVFSYSCYYCDMRDCSVKMEQSVAYGAGIWSVGDYDLKIYSTQILATQQWTPAGTVTTTAGIFVQADPSVFSVVVNLTNSNIGASSNAGTPGIAKYTASVYLDVDSTAKQVRGDFSRLSSSSGTGDDYFLYRSVSGYASFTLCYLGGGTNSSADLNLLGCVP